MLFALLLLACARPTPPPTAVRALTYPNGAAAEVLAGTWSALAQVPDDWVVPPVASSDMGVEQWWCGPGTDTDACWTGTLVRAERRGTAWRGLSMESTPREGAGPGAAGARLDGVRLEVGEVPDTGRWGMGLTLELTPSLEVGDWQLILVRLAGDQLTSRFVMGPTLEYGIEQTTIESPGPAFATLLQSPTGFAGAAERVTALQSQALRQIDAHAVKKCAYGRYYGDGRPRCDVVPLDASDEESARYGAEAHLDPIARALTEDAVLLHQMLGELVPAALTAALTAGHPEEPPVP